MFPDSELGNQLLIKDCTSWSQVSTCLEVPFVLFTYGCPGLISWFWAWGSVDHDYSGFFISRADCQPTPTSKPVRFNFCLNDLSREASHRHHSASAILIPLHPFSNVVRDNTPGLHTHAYYIPELLFLGSMPPICLSLGSCQNVSVELTAKFVQAVHLCFFCEDS